MVRFVVHYEKHDNGNTKQSVYFTDADTKEDAFRYACRELQGCHVHEVDKASHWLSFKERAIASLVYQLSNLSSNRVLNGVLAELSALQSNYIEAYGPAEATRIERLMAMARRNTGQNVIVPPQERICFASDSDDQTKHITDTYMLAESDPGAHKKRRKNSHR